MIRKADYLDKRAVTGLHYMAGPNILNYFFAANNKQEALSILEVLYDTENNIFSKDNFYVIEDDKTIKGAIALYKGKDKKQLESNVFKNMYKIFRECGLTRLSKMIARCIFNNFSPNLYDDELYIHAISVLPQYRGQQIASKLLKYAFDKAKEMNIPKLSLVVEIQNEHARKVYEKYGFKIVETKNFKSELETHELYGYHKMVAEL